MAFNSLEFLLYFTIVTILYFLINIKYRWIWLLVASYFFYMCWNIKYAFLMGFSTLVTYFSGILIENSVNISDLQKRRKYKKIYLFLSFFINLSILFFFKYVNFFSNNLNYLFEKINIEIKFSNLNILLPVGISFYTFQALGYIMDVYRGETKAKKHLGKYALFVSFFPQLVAGPIERSTHLLRQLDSSFNFEYNRVKNGVLLMIWGFFKKIIIADRLAVIVNNVYNYPENYEGFILVIATIFFAFQIYCDFSSYSDIARGSAKVMGYDLMKNFEKPYFSKSVGEFWRKWHISLGKWFRDYVYFPLGGSKISENKKLRNIMIVFFISGLWHGASWNFIIWGILLGTYQIIEIKVIPIKNYIIEKLKINQYSIGYKIYEIIITFVMIDFAWIFFRASNIKEAIYIVKKIFIYNPQVLWNGSLYKLGLDKYDFNLCFLLIIFLLIIWCFKGNENLLERISEKNIFVRWTFYIIFMLSFFVIGYYPLEPSQFIYFQF